MKHFSLLPKRTAACMMLAALGVMALSGCDRQVFFTEEHSVDEAGWSMTDSIGFDVEVADTTTYYNFMIDIRNTNDYPYANLIMFLRVTLPDGNITKDTLQYQLADETGKWLGRQSGEYVSSRRPLFRNSRFPMTGTYHISLSHGMRDKQLPGISDVGFRIEYADLTK